MEYMILGIVGAASIWIAGQVWKKERKIRTNSPELALKISFLESNSDGSWHLKD
jgi:hypothetical protein